jgi:hypothetical protein
VHDPLRITSHPKGPRRSDVGANRKRRLLRVAALVFTPTFKEFAAAWLQSVQEHTAPNPEWAFLADRARGTTAKDWKKLRAKKAASVLKRLHEITIKLNRRCGKWKRATWGKCAKSCSGWYSRHI